MPEIVAPLVLPPKKTAKVNPIQFHQVAHQDSLSYYLFCPENLSSETKIIVCVHGISRNAKQQITAFQQQAINYNHVIIAPCFSEKYYQGYQRLKIGSAGCSPSEALNKILNDVHEKYTIKTENITLFGYSGGAQFSHRYAMLYPEKINKLIVCASGWFTFPDENKNFPYGLKGTQDSVKSMAKNLPAFLQLKIRILVGEFDNTNDPGLNRKKRINRQQGYHRLQRAIRWSSALQSKCNDMNLEADLRFILIKGCGHSFSNCERLGDISKYLFSHDN
jgi:predicted esterase